MFDSPEFEDVLTYDISSDDQVQSLSTVKANHLNPLLLAVYLKSFACLKGLVSEFSLRAAVYDSKWVVVPGTPAGSYRFSNLLLPLLLKNKDVESLSFLLRQD